MPNVFNIFNIRVNAISSNGSVNLGNTIIKGNTTETKSVGGNSVVGDCTSSINNETNLVNNPDFTANPSVVI
ncbi:MULTISPECIES: spore germination protein [Paenibacillus]|uniref:spore germination protein n=1 Tax=Paenibacillus TaxID=44249 RepID=UPI0004155E5C|nr:MULTISPECIES: spore germination protein [Paenibacillus]MCR8843895.1 spore germination protein [Paenibacillus sp. SC116]